MRRALLIAAVLAALAGTGCATGVTRGPGTITDHSALVTGIFVTNGEGRFVDSWVEYGPTKAYGFSTQHSTSELDPGAYWGSANDFLSGLQRGTTYHYRVCASDSTQVGGPGCGEDRQFTTQSFVCGDTVTTDVRLTGDTGCSGGPYALKIGADGVEIDLAGHALSGSVSQHGEGPAGIVNPDGYDDVRVRHGKLSFINAFSATSASRNRLLNVHVSAVAQGVDFSGGADNEVRRSDIVGYASGAVVASGSRFVLADSDVESVFSPGAQINGDDARIVNDHFPTAIDADHRAEALRVVANRAHVAGNHVTGKWVGGFFLQGSNHVVVDNQLTGVLGDGIFVDAFSNGVTLRGNTVTGAADDGIDVRAAGTRLEGNAAYDNGDWGIDGVAGVIDLGGNVASSNGQFAGCRNVVCN